MKKAVFQLEPLTCPSCIKKIESTLNKTAGVAVPKVLFNSGKVKLDYDEAVLDSDQIAEKISKLGYQVISTKVS